MQLNVLSCGGCRACCTALPVIELDKDAFQPCQHECSLGCGIYPQRPQGCRDWNCLWKMGLLGPNENRRPDKCGYVLDNIKAEGTQYVIAYQVGADNPDRLNYLTNILMRWFSSHGVQMPEVRLVDTTTPVDILQT